jgi:hypothetical protein
MVYISLGNNRSRFAISSIYHNMYHSIHHGFGVYTIYIPFGGIYNGIYLFWGIYHGTYKFPCLSLDCCILNCYHFQVAMLHRLASLCFPLSLTVVGHKAICQIGALETGETTNMYCRRAVRAEDRVQGPLAYLCDNLPRLKTGDITALLHDFPIPIAGDFQE